MKWRSDWQRCSLKPVIRGKVRSGSSRWRETAPRISSSTGTTHSNKGPGLVCGKPDANGASNLHPQSMHNRGRKTRRRPPPRSTLGGKRTLAGQRSAAPSSDHKFDPVETHNSVVLANGGGDQTSPLTPADGRAKFYIEGEAALMTNCIGPQLLHRRT